jgi:hypothetical protein
VITFVGRQLIGSPYEANTLDRPGHPEELVCNLGTFDCVTFVENVLALSRCIKGNRLAYEAYEHELLTIRYRGGVINGYASRLHYFSDWIGDNERKGIVREISRTIGVPYRKPIRFMSSHRSSYPRLSADSTFAEIGAREDTLNAAARYYVPKKELARSEGGIENGDLIAITTTTDGLDVSHTGIAVRLEDGTLHLLHAPDAGEHVRITAETLTGYLRKHRSQTGVMVARAIPPSE